MAECILNPASQDVADFIYRFGSLQNNLRDPEQFPCVDYVSNDYAVFYTELENALPLSLERQPYYSIPSLFTLLDDSAMEAAGIVSALQTPALSNMGSGVIIGIVDTGIDYTSPVFRKSDGTTRILGLWDQTLPEDPSVLPPGVPEYYPMGGASYGTEFTHEEINEALTLEDPFSLVPSKDTDGHGTFLAGLAAGTAFPLQNFTGAAPMADLAIVKLKPAKKYLRDYYLISEDTPAFQENDIMMGMDFAVRIANDRRMPLSLCLGIGSSQGAHIGKNPLSLYVDYISQYSLISVSVAAGNEGAARHHYAGRLTERENQALAELRVGNKEPGFTMEFWGEPPEIYNLSLQSPTGETLDISASLGAVTQELSFVFVETRVKVNYVSIERQTGYTLVYFQFIQPVPGIWRIFVRGRDGQNVGFHMWLPVQGLISEETYFLEPSPYNTVTAPGDSLESITVTAYQYRDNSLYVQASRGFMPDGNVVPQVAAPGVQIRVPQLNGLYGNASGTSLSAAQTAGAAALLFEWAVIRGNQPYFTGSSVKNYITRGAEREERMQYPNRDWGFGRMDLYHTFELLA